jgi:hypothetical protein
MVDAKGMTPTGVPSLRMLPVGASRAPSRGFGAHSDQEPILESELHRFVRLNWDIATSLARPNSVTVP